MGYFDRIEISRLHLNCINLIGAPKAFWELSGFIIKNISVIDALCGSNVDVEAPSGKVNIWVEAGTEHGKMHRINGKGIPDVNYGLGDLYIKLNIKIPKNIPVEEKLILEKLKNSNTFKV